MLGSIAAAPILMAGHKLHCGQAESHIMIFGVSKAFNTTLNGYLALFLRHMGLPEKLFQVFQTLSFGTISRIVSVHDPTWSIQPQRSLRQGTAKTTMLNLLLPEPLLCNVANKANDDGRRNLPPGLVQAYYHDPLMMAHIITLFMRCGDCKVPGKYGDIPKCR